MEDAPPRPSRDLDAALFEFHALVITDRARGSSRSLVDYQRRFPGCEAEIAVEHERLLRAAASDTPPPDAVAERIGRYRVLHELGRGGQARVLLALDEALGRHVALKVVASSFGAVTTERRERLRREANAISRLDHPAICAVYEAQLEGATPFLAMRYVPGETLAAKLARARKLRGQGREDDGSSTASSPALRPQRADALAELLRFFERLARAAHAAHEAGLVHRDVKPSNVMVTPAGEPVILDFGLARDETSDEITLTQGDAVIGTPAYMAPEQLRLVPDEPDRRTDVYGLGAALYECLTLERPFAGKSADSVRESIRAGALADPRVHNPRIPADVRVVLATALEREPARRYASALELAEDLRRVCEYEPIRARPPSAWKKLRRWTQRHPAIASSLTIAFVALGVVAARERSRAIEVSAREAAEREARAARATAEERWSAAYFREKSAEWAERLPLLALALALRAHEIEPAESSRRILVDTLAMPTPERLFGRPYNNPAEARDLAKSAQLAAVGDATGRLGVWDITRNERALDLEISAGPVTHVDFDASGRRIAYSTELYEAGIVDQARGAISVRLEGHDDVVTWAEFGPNGELVATASLDGTVRIWNAADGRELARMQHGADGVGIVRWSPDGCSVVSVLGRNAAATYDRASDHVARVWDVGTGDLIRELVGPLDEIRSLEFSSDSRSVLATANDETVRLWAVASGRERWSVRLPSVAERAHFSRDGTRIAAGLDPGLRILDAESGALIREIAESGGRRVTDVAFSLDGAFIAAASFDAVVRVWRVEDGERVAELRGLWGRPVVVDFTSDGARIVCVEESGRVHVWRFGETYLPRRLVAGDGELSCADLDATGARAVTAGASGAVRLWRVDDANARPAVLSTGTAPIWTGFDARAERLWIVRADGAYELRDDPSWSRVLFRGALGTRPTCAGFSDSGRFAHAGDDVGQAWVLDVHGDGTLRCFEGKAARVERVRVSPDDSTLLVARDDGVVVVWDLVSHARVATLTAPAMRSPGQLPVFDAAFSPDGKLAAIGFGQARAVSLYRTIDWTFVEQWDTPTSGAIHFWAGGSKLFHAAKFSAMIATLRLQPFSLIKSANLGSWTLSDSAASPDGRFVATSWSTLTTIVHDLNQGTTLLWLTGHTKSVACVRFSRDSGRLITASRDGSAMVWPVDVAGEARRRVLGDLTEIARLYGIPDIDPSGVLPLPAPSDIPH